MTDTITTSRYRSGFTPLLVATLVISAMFFEVARPYLVAMFFAGVMSELSRPLQNRITGMLGGRRHTGTSVTVLVLIVAVIVPILTLLYMAAVQAAGLADTVQTIVRNLSQTTMHDALPDWLPAESTLESWVPTILNKLGELTGAVAGFVVSSLSAMTLGAARLFLNLFVFFYALYYFLLARSPVLLTILGYTGLTERTQTDLFERVLSISRATLKGTLVIGLIQGILGALGFWMVGFQNIAFWIVIMSVMAMIPSVGAALVVVGGAIFLALQGNVGPAIGLAAWGVVVVGTVDNLLRPILVGRDAQLNQLLILVSTLGGLGIFGMAGLVLGPVLAGLFVTIWVTLNEAVRAKRASEAAAQQPVPAEVPKQ